MRKLVQTATLGFSWLSFVTRATVHSLSNSFPATCLAADRLYVSLFALLHTLLWGLNPTPFKGTAAAISRFRLSYFNQLNVDIFNRIPVVKEHNGNCSIWQR